MVHCNVGECSAHYKYHAQLTNYLMGKAHKLPEAEALRLTQEAKAIEMKKLVLGDDLNAELLIVLLDLETTGLIQRDKPYPRIAEVALKMLNKADCSYNSLVDPEIPMPPAATQINHITDEMTSTAPTFHLVALSMIEEISSVALPQDRVVIMAHNGAKFDEPILRSEFARCGLSIPNNWIFVDSIPLFKSCIPKQAQQSYSLAALHKRLLHEDIPVSEHHRASGDVNALERCLRALLPGVFEERLVGALLGSM